jgi:hypothetical protein
MYMGDNVKDQAAADAANFHGTMYGDGMMVMPKDWERLGMLFSIGLFCHINRPLLQYKDWKRLGMLFSIGLFCHINRPLLPYK